MELSLLKQEIEFLQFQLEDYKAREIQQKTMYETMLKSLQSPTKPNTSEDLENYKSLINDLQRKQEDALNTENLLKTQLEYLQASTGQTISELKSKIFQMSSEKQTFEQILQDKDKEIKSLKALQCENRQLKQAKEELEKSLEYQKFESIKRQERIIEDLEYLHQSKLTNLNTLIENLYSRLAETPQLDVKNEIKPLITPVQLTKTAQVLKSIDKIKSLTDSIESSQVQQALHSLLSLYEDLSAEPKTSAPKHGRSYTFAPLENSPISQSKENDPEFLQKRLETIFTFSTAFQCEFCKSLVNKPKYYEHLLECINQEQPKNVSKNEIFYETEDFFGISLNKKTEGIGKMEEQISSLKLTLGKLKNQRDKARIMADKMLGGLKQAKLELAVAEEVAGQRVMELKVEIKNLVNFLLVVRNNLSFPAGFSQEVEKIVERTAKIFGGRICVRSSN